MRELILMAQRTRAVFLLTFRETVDVKKICTRLGLSQESFAQTYGFALSAVRDWEQGRRRPERSARILLKIVEKEPEAVTRALTR